jgi:hypothetical protein
MCVRERERERERERVRERAREREREREREKERETCIFRPPYSSLRDDRIVSTASFSFCNSSNLKESERERKSEDD